MKLDRKRFLRNVGAGVLGLATAGNWRLEASSQKGVVLPKFHAGSAQAFWSAVRSNYTVKEGFVYLNCGGLGPAPHPVLARYRAVTAELEETVDAGRDLFEAPRKALAGFLGAKDKEICFVRNATEGNSIVASGLDLKAGDEVIFESHAHPGGSLPWLNLARQQGVKVKTFVPDAGSAEGNLERIAAVATSRTKVIQVSHITAPTGLVMPVKAIGQWAHDRGCWFHIDGAQSAGMIPFSLREIGCDSYATSGHKWLGGPRETGVLFIREDKIDRVSPRHIGSYSSDDYDFSGKLTFVEGVRRHEYGTRNAASIVALGEAVRFQETIGRERLAEYGTTLGRRLHEGLARIPKVTVLTPTAHGLRASITTFAVAGADAGKVFGYLLKEGGLRCRPVTEDGLQAIRVSTHVFNTAEECDRVVACVGSLIETL